MMQQYWVAVLLLLLMPLTFFLLKKDRPIVKEEKPIAAKQEKDVTRQPVFTPAIDSIMPDTLLNMTAQEQTIPETVQNKEQTDSIEAIPSIPLTPRHDLVDFIPDTPIKTPIKRDPSSSLEMAKREEVRPKVKRQMKHDWQLALAYAGTPSSDMTRTDNYMTMPSYAGAATRSTKLYNWGDYMNYVNENAPMMDSVSASNMSRVAIINAGHPSEPLTETKHHERPLTLQLSLSRQFNSRWSLSTGLSYTRMKSTFQGGNENTQIHRTQRLHYLGIPLHLHYRLTGGKRWSLYTSGGLQLDIPVSAKLSTQYIYGGPYAHLDTSSAVETTINAPWQWSFGIGAGVQYEIVPHLKVYLEPSLNYYIPSSDAVETYRTEHPLDLSLPLGIRISW